MKALIGVVILAALLPACGKVSSTGPNVPEQAQKEKAETDLLDADAGKPDVGDPSPK